MTMDAAGRSRSTLAETLLGIETTTSHWLNQGLLRSTLAETLLGIETKLWLVAIKETTWFHFG